MLSIRGIAQNLNAGHILKNNSQIRLNYALYLIMNVPTYLDQDMSKSRLGWICYKGALPN